MEGFDPLQMSWPANPMSLDSVTAGDYLASLPGVTQDQLGFYETGDFGSG